MVSMSRCTALFIALMSGVMALSAQQPLEQGEQPLRIVMFAPTSEGNEYWPQVFSVMNEAAGDLGIELLTYQFDVADRYSKILEGAAILRSFPRPDAAIISVAYGQAMPLLETAQSLDIPVILQGPLFPSELEGLGVQPRTRYSSWIGMFSQDEVRKGYLLARRLAEAVRRSHPGEHIPFPATPEPRESETGAERPIRMLAISGDSSWQGTFEREAGLRLAAEEDPGIEVLQVVPTLWSPREAREKTLSLIDRYGAVDAIWCASDQLAFGAIQALRQLGLEPGTQVFVGGLDASPPGLEVVQQGVMEVSVAPTLLSYAELLICLYDYLNGFDFLSDMGFDIQSQVITADAERAGEILRLYEGINQLDFRLFSKTLNPGIRNYDFSLSRYLHQLGP